VVVVTARELRDAVADSGDSASVARAVDGWFLSMERATVDAMVAGYLDWLDRAEIAAVRRAVSPAAARSTTTGSAGAR